MPNIKRFAALAPVCLALLAGTLSAQQAPESAMPPPSPADRDRHAAVAFAPYRYGDLLWENDRTAHRIYGRPLEAYEPPSGSGIDVWGKNVSWPYMERQLRTNRQHDNHGEGLDFYNVRESRGAGGLGIWQDNKLWVSRNYARYAILSNGPHLASFSADYDPWPVGITRMVWETRRFTLPAGSNFTRMVSTLNSDKPGPLVVGIGIAKHPTSDTTLGSFSADKATGRMSWWGPTDPEKGTMAVALLVDPAAIVGVTADTDNYLVLVRVQPGKPFVYYSGSTWDRAGQFATRAAWDAYVAAQTPDFDPRMASATGAAKARR